MPELSAETTYLFRHALLREGAYQLMPPAARAALHLIVADALEAMLRGAAERDPAGVFAAAIAAHLRQVRELTGRPDLEERELEFVRRAARAAEGNFRTAEAHDWWLRATQIGPAADRAVR